VKFIILAVKPQFYSPVIKDIENVVNKDKVIISIAPGISIDSLKQSLGFDTRIVRAMPNTPALVNCGMTSLSPNKNLDKNDIEAVKTIFDSFGKSEIVDESLIDVVIGASGSSPAYAFMFIEAMADCAVSYGMKREMAYEFCAQSLMGAAKMVLETKKHPGELKDMVCSPGGTTIEAVKTLENEGMRSAVIKGMASCIEKSIKMDNK
jgi:pyrroline-5-carboxylate reductase